MTLEDKYWLELLQAVIEGKMSDAEANQSWYEYINERKDMRGMINENLIQERMNQLRETGMFKFIEDIPKDNLWKIVFAVLYLFNDAEPKIIRCGECTHKDKKIDYCHCLGITICECDFCSFAERRTDAAD